MRFDPPTLDLLERQLGLLTRPQLLAGGYGPKQVDAMVRRGHLEQIHHGTYRRTGSACAPEQRALAAVLRCRPAARLCGPLLLGLVGAEGYSVEDPFTVLVQPGRRVSNVPFDVRTDPYPADDTANYGALPGVTPTRNLLELAVDLPATGPGDDALLRAFDVLRWRGSTDRRRLYRVLEDRPDHPGTARLARLVAAGYDRQESGGERGLARALAGFEPQPDWQVWVSPTCRVDALFRDCGLVLESNGVRTHSDPRDRAADAARAAELAALGLTVLVVTAEDLREPAGLRRRIAAARAHLLGT